MRNNTVGTTEITPVETEVTKSEKQESRDFSRGGFKTKKVSCEKLDNLMKKHHAEGYNETLYPIGGGEDNGGFNIAIRSYLLPTEKAELCARVVAQLFEDDTYNPFVRDDVTYAAIISYFTNIKADNLTPERLAFLVYDVNLVAKIESVSPDQYKDIMLTIDRAVETINADIREKRQHDIDAILDEVKALTDKFAKVGNSLDALDLNAVVSDVNKIANMNDEERVRNVLKVTAEKENEGT